jgi:hypothetical protein
VEVFDVRLQRQAVRGPHYASEQRGKEQHGKPANIMP